MAIHRGHCLSLSRHYLSGEGAWQGGNSAPVSLGSPALSPVWGPIAPGDRANCFFVSRDSLWHSFASDGTDINHAWRRDRGAAISGPAAETVLTGGGTWSSMAMDWGHGKDGSAILAAWDDASHDWSVTGISSSNGVNGWTSAALQPLATECMPLAGLARDRDGAYWFAYSDYSAAGTGVFRLKRSKNLSDSGVGDWVDIAIPVPVMAEPALVAGVCNVIGADVHVLNSGLLLFTIFHWFDFGGLLDWHYLASRLVATYDDADPDVLTWSGLKGSQPGFDYYVLWTGYPFEDTGFGSFADAIAGGYWPFFGVFQGRDGRIDWVVMTATGTMPLHQWKKIAKDGTVSPAF